MLTWNDTTLQALLSMGHLFPHLMFVGTHEHELYDTLRVFMGKLGRSASDNDVLVHECETHGGIAAVREVLRPFTRSPRHPRPTLVVLRRFDRLSPDAQFALRRTMEIDQDKCRCLAVATSTTSIIQPLHSRFVVISCTGRSIDRAVDSRPGKPKRIDNGPGVWPSDAHMLAAATVAEVRRYAREGGAACDVRKAVERWADEGNVPWRLVVAVALVEYEAVDEACAVYLMGVLCRNWIRGERLFCYAS